MNKSFKFNVNEPTIIQRENVGAILLDIDAQTTAPAVANISDLNKIRFDVSIQREGSSNKTVHFKGFLMDYINAMYEQTTQKEVILAHFDGSYKLLFSFGAYPIELNGNDKLFVDVTVPTTAFTSSSVTNSIVSLETIEAVNQNQTGLIPQIESYPVGAQKDSFNEHVGDNVISMSLDVDNGETYVASAKAKPVSFEMTSGGFSIKRTQSALVALNKQLLSANPESDVKNLVLYRNKSVLRHDVEIDLKFDKPVEANSKVLVTRLVHA